MQWLVKYCCLQWCLHTREFCWQVSAGMDYTSGSSGFNALDGSWQYHYFPFIYPNTSKWWKRTKLVNLCHLARVKTSCLNTSPLKKSKKSAQIYFRVSLRVSLLSICVNVMTPLVLGSQLVPKILQNTAKKRLNQAKLLPERFPEVVSLPNSFLLQTSVSSQGLTYTDGCWWPAVSQFKRAKHDPF